MAAVKHEFPKRIKTSYSYDDSSLPPSVLLIQFTEGKDQATGTVILTEEVFTKILEHVSEMRPEFAKAAARVYWRSVKRGKREAGNSLDECRTVEIVAPQPAKAITE